MRCAYFTPLNPLKTGIADYAEELLDALKKHMDVDVYIEEGYTPKLNHGTPENIYPHTKYRPVYDVNLFQIGNGKHHLYMLPYLKKYGGVITLHDFNLFHMNTAFPKFTFYNLLKKIFANHGLKALAQIMAKITPQDAMALLNPLRFNNTSVYLTHGLHFNGKGWQAIAPDIGFVVYDRPACARLKYSSNSDKSITIAVNGSRIGKFKLPKTGMVRIKLPENKIRDRNNFIMTIDANDINQIMFKKIEFITAEGKRRALDPIMTGLFGKLIDRDRLVMNRRILNQSKSVVVHNNYLKSIIERNYKNVNVKMIRHGIKKIEERDKIKTRKKLKIDKNAIMFSCFGFVEPSKKIDYVLAAFKYFNSVAKNSKLYVIGKKNPHYDVDSLIKFYDLKDKVIVTDKHHELSEFYDYIRASDLCFNLRHFGSQGEASGSLLRIMSLGKPVAISNFNQYAEFPGNACIKIDLGEKSEEIERIFRIMLNFRNNPAKFEKIGKNAKKHMLENHSWEKIAGQYAEFMKNA